MHDGIRFLRMSRATTHGIRGRPRIPLPTLKSPVCPQSNLDSIADNSTAAVPNGMSGLYHVDTCSCSIDWHVLTWYSSVRAAGGACPRADRLVSSTRGSARFRATENRCFALVKATAMCQLGFRQSHKEGISLDPPRVLSFQRFNSDPRVWPPELDSNLGILLLGCCALLLDHQSCRDKEYRLF